MNSRTSSIALIIAVALSIRPSLSREPPQGKLPQEKSTNETTADEKLASPHPVREPVKLPGILIDFERRCVDLEATICLDKGLLELVACIKSSKEHESIVAVSAKAIHIHTALLLLGANNGNPAMRQQIGQEEKRWVDLPPRGDPIDVSLITMGGKEGATIERPISDFVVRSNPRFDEVDGEVLAAPKPRGVNKSNKGTVDIPNGTDNENGDQTPFPRTFVFAGSHLRENKSGPRQYLADQSGNVISIATFGDELLCLPFHQTQKNDALMWQVKPKSLPKRGTQVTLRLRLKNTEPSGSNQ